MPRGTLRRLEKVNRMRVFRAALLFSVFSLSLEAAVDLVLRNGLVYDGTGRPPVHAHVSIHQGKIVAVDRNPCLLYTSPSPRDKRQSRMPSSA